MNTLSKLQTRNTSAVSSADTPSLKTKKENAISSKGEEKIFSKIVSAVFFFAVCFVIYAGWKIRAREYFTAESGTGYVLGIVGSVLMLALIIYPLRKRYRFMEPFGSVKTMFQTHMIMGILGPVCILFHANFQLGSLNSNVAFFAMIVVASSGLIGRYMYKRIHYGLYGRRATLNDLRSRYENEKGEMAQMLDFSPAISKHLLAFSDQVLRSRQGFFQSLASVIVMGITTRVEHWQIRRLMTRELKYQKGSRGWDSSHQRRLKKEAHLRTWTFLRHVRKVAEFNFYERMFSLWHVFHLPLAIMLLFSGIFHVLAVHAY
jgi:hypothetical protein